MSDATHLERVVLMLCNRCLDGEGGECHTPGCALWMNRAPDSPLRNHVWGPVHLTRVPSDDTPTQRESR